jgi:hypothetical protein
LPGWEAEAVLTSYVVGLAGIALLLAAWLAVQLAWRRAFPDAAGDADALAGRLGCHGCDAVECGEKHCEDLAPEAEEDLR